MSLVRRKAMKPYYPADYPGTVERYWPDVVVSATDVVVDVAVAVA